MKIGTDGVLLGAWTPLTSNPNTILDVGAGTGIISLQLAQRSDAQTIDAIEIDDNAYEQCTENFENSHWGDRLFCYHASVQEFASEIDETYDLIVSNPPFYSEDYKSSDEARDTARFTDALPFQHLLVCVAHLLSEEGVFSVIIPKKEEEGFISLASESDLFPFKICHVQGTPSSEVKRSMLAFSFQKKKTETTSLVIENSRHDYTPEYIQLVQDFYLKM
ncbi:tRNA1(Val) (adenine(37)-N6)-methyltransferase [Jejudonia soesokkakensis]|uniref:tRNA1(Val) (adenine(37)-N6)-methyltransferase n=1 Tax=Jejudonia soesokkakensis TaxID=1323432 RepID=A0ABW2MRG2_9FLAO